MTYICTTSSPSRASRRSSPRHAPVTVSPLPMCSSLRTRSWLYSNRCIAQPVAKGIQRLLLEHTGRCAHRGCCSPSWAAGRPYPCHPRLRQPACRIVGAEEHVGQAVTLLLAVMRHLEDRRDMLLRSSSSYTESSPAAPPPSSGSPHTPPSQSPPARASCSCGRSPLSRRSAPGHLFQPASHVGLIAHDHNDCHIRSLRQRRRSRQIVCRRHRSPARPPRHALRIPCQRRDDGIRRRAAIPVERNLIRQRPNDGYRLELLRIKRQQGETAGDL